MQSLREGLKIPTIIIPQNTLTCYILLTLMLMMLIPMRLYYTPFMIGIRVHILRRWGICVIKFLQFFSASLDIIIIIITAEEGHQKLDFFQIGDPNLIWECLRENFFTFWSSQKFTFWPFFLLNLGHVCSEHETSLLNCFQKLKIAMNIHSVLNTA